MIEGRGKLVDAHTICVNGKNYTVSIQWFHRWRIKHAMSISKYLLWLKCSHDQPSEQNIP